MATEHTQSLEEEEEEVQVEADPTPPPDTDTDAAPQPDTNEAEPEPERARNKRDTKKDPDREPGKSILPFSRVQRIIKADKELPMVARDATFLISLATEEFIKRLSQACQKLAEREKRTTVQQRDVAGIVRRVDEFLFLEGMLMNAEEYRNMSHLLAEIIGSQESTGRRKPQKAGDDIEAPHDQDQQQSTLRNFIQKTSESEDTRETNNVVMNEDGIMYAG
ncbi:hypothetical protein JVU11DRAFT_3211 [Chiua virens]|nr:hypothetical protein JVU11DRAFT_3211 [Chiua virens]